MSLSSILSADENTPQFVFCGNRLLVRQNPPMSLPPLSIAARCLEFQVAEDWFTDTGHSYTALMLENGTAAPAGYGWISLRQYFARGQDSLAAAASRAHALLEWRRTVRYCHRCGFPLKDLPEETARRCIKCGDIQFPAISPAIIVLVRKEDRILLARHIQRNTDIFTCLAGYIEPGETAETCVAREIKEEAGIDVCDITYRMSQSWPFPDQLMLGFTAEWKSGELHPQPQEIDELGWFSRDNLPSTPPPGSLAYKLITEF